MLENLDMQLLADGLTLGGVGFVVGVLLPWAFWLIGRLVKAVRVVVE